jgi:hypothetical protein
MDAGILYNSKAGTLNRHTENITLFISLLFLIKYRYYKRVFVSGPLQSDYTV